MNHEDLLQERLEMLEAGQPLDACLAGLPSELAEALQMAVVLREEIVPVLAAPTAAQQRAGVVALASQTLTMPAPTLGERIAAWFKARTATEWVFTAVMAPALTVLLVALIFNAFRNPTTQPVVSEDPTAEVATTGQEPEVEVEVAPPTAAPTAVAASEEAAPVAEVAAERTGFLAFLPMASNPLETDPTTAALERTQGVVEVQTATGDWVSVGHLAAMQAGQRVRTGPFSAATLTFFDGSQAILSAESELSIDQLNALRPADGYRTVVLTQWEGQSEHHVEHRGDGGSRYEVQNPDGTGIARGTVFQVIVLKNKAARYIVLEGRVDVTNINITVSVLAGQITTIFSGQSPSTPAFRVTGEGEVSQIGEIWIVGGQSFTTDENTIIIGNPQVGDLAYVEGHLASNGDRVADRITLLQNAPSQHFTLQGEVTSIAADTWVIAGQTISVTTATLIVGEPAVGDIVRVSGRITADTAFVAESIVPVTNVPGLPFSFVGVLESQADNEWVISGATIAIDDETSIMAGLEIGDTVRVIGFILDDNRWLATSIVWVANPSDSTFLITGLVESLEPWQVAGLSFETRPWTTIGDDIALGDRVQVSGIILEDGTWVASEIVKLDGLPSNIIILIGTLTSMEPWSINDLPLLVTETTLIGEVVVGDTVQAVIEILPNGDWVAQSILPLAIGTPTGCFYVNAVVLGINGTELRLQHWPTISLEGVQVQGDLVPNSVILIHICISADGTIIVIGDVVVITIIIIVLPGSPTAPPSGGETVICHRPPGNPDNSKTMTASGGSLQAHLGHGDTLGPCP